eukprot:UN21782
MKSNEIESKEQRERDINSKVKELRDAVDKAEKRVSLAPDHKELALAKLDKAMEAIHKNSSIRNLVDYILLLVVMN